MTQQGSNNNDAFFGSGSPFMQAGQNMTQQFMDFLSKAGNPHTAAPPPVDPQALTDMQRDFMNQQM